MSLSREDFLPVNMADMQARGWNQLDFIFVSGDAYVDHPAFGPAIITRLLEKHGYRVGILAQPDWHTEADFLRLGRPRLGFLVSGGNLDSMLDKFTAAKKIRHEDAYSPGGKAGCRPERAVSVYCHILRKLWQDVPIIIGGIEASLRRLVHYDYWTDAIRPSILYESKADLLIYGMGERQILSVAHDLHSGISIENIQDVPGTCYTVPGFDYIYDYDKLPSFTEIKHNKSLFAKAYKAAYLAQDPFTGCNVAQQNALTCCVVQNKPPEPLTEKEMDAVYDLPYQRDYHPDYESRGGVPAIKEVRFSIAAHRGCFGGCSFCAINSHQGRIIQHRSDESILREAKIISQMPGFKGYIHDVGGPTANFHQPSCVKQLTDGTCRTKQCLSPRPCSNLKVDHSSYLSLLHKLRALPKIKKVFIRSGIRFDYLLLAHDDFLEELCRYHISGQLKVAPEHVAEQVTVLMGKSSKDVFMRFAKRFAAMNEKIGKKQYLVPYFMSSHPGADLQEAVELAEFIRDMGYHPQQVQDFIPTPGTLSTCMYYTGLNPFTDEAVYVARTAREKQMQRALLQYWLPNNKFAVVQALRMAGRTDLIGYGKRALVRPLSGKSSTHKKVPYNKGGC